MKQKEKGRKQTKKKRPFYLLYFMLAYNLAWFGKCLNYINRIEEFCNSNSQ